MTVKASIPAAILTAAALLWIAGLIGFSVHIKGLRPANFAHTEAIVVLTGGPDRINTGLDLLAARKADYLFITGVDTRVSAEQLVAIWRHDVKQTPCCIILGHYARNTFENAAEARDWIKTNNIKSVRLLTADYHMPRAQLAFAAMVPGVELSLHPIASSDAAGSFPRYMTLAVREYNKTLLTWARLRVSRGNK